MDSPRILVIRLGRTGDIVMITAALTALLKKYPSAQIDVLTSLDGKRLLKGFHSRLQVLYVHQRKSLFEYWQRNKIIKSINSINYNEVYCFELNPGITIFYNQLKAGIHQLELKPFVENYAHLCLELVVGETQHDSEHEWVSLPVCEQGQQDAKRLLASQNVDDDTVVIGFHPSFSGLKKNFFRSIVHKTEKAWPVDNFAHLAMRLYEYAAEHKIKLAIIMDLLPEDRSLGEDIVKASNGQIKLFVPDLDFERYKAMLARMSLLVVPNTGPMHIAGAVGTRIVALFGNISPLDSGAYVPADKREFLYIKPNVKGDASMGIAGVSAEMAFEACVNLLKRELSQTIIVSPL